jgi:hypothetical protein
MKIDLFNQSLLRKYSQYLKLTHKAKETVREHVGADKKSECRASSKRAEFSMLRLFKTYYH